ncbi:MAG: prolyl oligopeptidase family serine peptidase [Acidobacteriota bacterium]
MLLLSGGIAKAETSWYCQDAAATPDVSTLHEIHWVDTELGRMKVVVVWPESRDPDRPLDLAFFIHADSPRWDPVYQYELARKLVALRPGTVAAAVLRPGYKDRCGDTSDGERGLIMGDNYSSEVVAALGSVLATLERRIAPAETFVLGHSGGAALTALLVSRHPELYDRSVLVACPCDLPAWRNVMAELTGNTAWTEPMPGLSPLDEITALDPSKPMHLFVGDDDVVTPPSLSETYLQKARQAGKLVTLERIPDAGHDMIIDDPEVFARIVASLDQKPAVDSAER